MIAKREQRQAYLGAAGHARAQLVKFIDDNLDEILLKGAFRLDDGFDVYGDEMYHWEWMTRRENIIEELSDALVYMSSGEY